MSPASPDAAELGIGDLSAASGVSRRLLRYYEEQQLITATRTPGGHRRYDSSMVAVVAHVRDLLDAGLPTRVIRELLGCVRAPGRLEPCAVPTLVEHLEGFDERIAGLTSTRNSLAGLIAASRVPGVEPRGQEPVDDGSGRVGRSVG